MGADVSETGKRVKRPVTRLLEHFLLLLFDVLPDDLRLGPDVDGLFALGISEIDIFFRFDALVWIQAGFAQVLDMLHNFTFILHHVWIS